MRDCARRTGTTLVDLFAEFDTDRLDDFRQDFLDIMHLRPSAYSKVARAVYHGIENVLAPSPMPVS